MQTPIERYHNDPAFAQLVDTIKACLYSSSFTPSEVREACVLATFRFECEQVRVDPTLLVNSQVHTALRILEHWANSAR